MLTLLSYQLKADVTIMMMIINCSNWNGEKLLGIILRLFFSDISLLDSFTPPCMHQLNKQKFARTYIILQLKGAKEDV
jgi:hypothetical protein